MNNRIPTALDDYMFDLNGYLILRNAVEPELVAALNREFDAFPRDLPTGAWYRGAQRRDYSAETGLELHNVVEIGEPFQELIDHPGWIEYVSRYAGEQDTYLEGLFIDECIASVRESGGFHPLHSGGFGVTNRCLYDFRNGAFRCGQVNIILALTDVGPGDGPTIVVPGSHKSNLPHPSMAKHTYGGSEKGSLPEGAIEAHLKAGDALLFVDAITHGGLARTNPGERRVLIYRYGPSWTRTRFGYQYSEELVAKLTPDRKAILQPVPPCPNGSNFIPVESPWVHKRKRAG